MFDISCDACQSRSLMTARSIVSFTNTDEGPKAIVECHNGHLVLRDFRTGTSTQVDRADLDRAVVAA